MAENTTQTTQTIQVPQAQGMNDFQKWLAGGAAAASLGMSAYNFLNNDSLSELPGVSGQVQAGVARQDAIANRLLSEQGLTDTQYNRYEKGFAEQSASLLANVTGAARNAMLQSPLMFEQLAKRAMEQGAGIMSQGMEKVQAMDIDATLQNIKASASVAEQAAKNQMIIDQRNKAIEEQRRKLDQQRATAFQKSVMDLAQSFGVIFAGTPNAPDIERAGMEGWYEGENVSAGVFADQQVTREDVLTDALKVPNTPIQESAPVKVPEQIDAMGGMLAAAGGSTVAAAGGSTVAGKLNSYDKELLDMMMNDFYA